MIENYKFDKLVGPSLSLAGFFTLFFSLVTVYFTLTAIPLIAIGAILAFSYRGTRIELVRKRYQSYLSLFGFIRLGFWLPFEKSDELVVKEIKGKQNLYVWENRKSKVETKDFRVLIKTSYNEKEVTLASFETNEDSQKLAKELENMIKSL